MGRQGSQTLIISFEEKVQKNKTQTCVIWNADRTGTKNEKGNMVRQVSKL